MVGIWHKNAVMSSKISMLNQNKCFFMSLVSKKGILGNNFSGVVQRSLLYKGLSDRFVRKQYGNGGSHERYESKEDKI